ncbi:MAG: Flp family type IVb pilin [Bacillota bacterium]|nr:Flp family type IVb pilin [Bacillota bacterium]
MSIRLCVKYYLWWARQEGVTTAEYALVLTLVVIILISTLSALGTALNAKLRGIIDQINGAH